MVQVEVHVCVQVQVWERRTCKCESQCKASMYFSFFVTVGLWSNLHTVVAIGIVSGGRAGKARTPKWQCVWLVVEQEKYVYKHKHASPECK